MTDNQLRKLNRKELLEILLQQSQALERLESENDSLKTELAQRNILISKAGSIAEAALSLNHIFEDAEAAAAQYLENIQALSGRQTNICQQLEQDSREKAERMIADAESRCAAMEAETQMKCARMVEKAEADAQAYWEKASQSVRQLMDQTAGLREFLRAENK